MKNLIFLLQLFLVLAIGVAVPLWLMAYGVNLGIYPSVLVFLIYLSPVIGMALVNKFTRS